MAADELLKTDQCPDTVRLTSTSKFYLTHNSGVTAEVKEMIMEGGVSKQSLDDIQMDLSTRRKNRFLQCHVEHEVALDYYCKEKGIHIGDMPAFSAMDDSKGYNVSPTDPSSDYISGLFKTLVAEY